MREEDLQMTEHHATLLSRNSVFQEATQGAPSELLEILENARNFLTTTVADSTKEVYARDWNGFVRWCNDLGLPHLPSSPDVVACYFTSLAMKEFRVPTIRRHCAAIAAAHREAGYPTPTSHPAIKELLHGMTRKIGCPAKPVDALLSAFLDINPKQIGRIGGGKHKPTDLIDVALLQSLCRKGVVDDLVGEYGHLIVDECHHISASSFEQVARACKARYVLGLSATPARKDGHHPIIFMQCGPIRYKDNAKDQAAMRPFEHKLIIRRTDFILPLELSAQAKPPIQDICSAIVVDTQRNDMILDDIIAAVEQGRSPVVITERKEHLEFLAAALSKATKNVVVLKGGMGAKQRRMVAEQLAAIPDTEERVIVATGRYLGEGFDDARLDTLFLTMPISWKGTLAQYAGRLHRLHANKREVRIYDYADLNVLMLARMHEKRLKGYRSIGYTRVES